MSFPLAKTLKTEVTNDSRIANQIFLLLFRPDMPRKESAKHNLSMSHRTKVFIKKIHFSDLGFRCLRRKTDWFSLPEISNIMFCFCIHRLFPCKTSLTLFKRVSIDSFPTVNHKRNILFHILALGIWQQVRTNSFRGVSSFSFWRNSYLSSSGRKLCLLDEIENNRLLLFFRSNFRPTNFFL